MNFMSLLIVWCVSFLHSPRWCSSDWLFFLVFIYIKVNFESRIPQYVDRILCFISVDGTDFWIQQPKPFWKGWYLQKLKGPGLCSEFSVSINTGLIVWTYGRFPPGACQDINVYGRSLKNKTCPGEIVIADKGYRGDPTTNCPNRFDHLIVKSWKGRNWVWHKTVNKRFL